MILQVCPDIKHGVPCHMPHATHSPPSEVKWNWIQRLIVHQMRVIHELIEKNDGVFKTCVWNKLNSAFVDFLSPFCFCFCFVLSFFFLSYIWFLLFFFMFLWGFCVYLQFLVIWLWNFVGGWFLEREKEHKVVHTMVRKSGKNWERKKHNENILYDKIISIRETCA